MHRKQGWQNLALKLLRGVSLLGLAAGACLSKMFHSRFDRYKRMLGTKVRALPGLLLTCCGNAANYGRPKRFPLMSTTCFEACSAVAAVAVAAVLAFAVLAFAVPAVAVPAVAAAAVAAAAAAAVAAVAIAAVAVAVVGVAVVGVAVVAAAVVAAADGNNNDDHARNGLSLFANALRTSITCQLTKWRLSLRRNILNRSFRHCDSI